MVQTTRPDDSTVPDEPAMTAGGMGPGPRGGSPALESTLRDVALEQDPCCESTLPTEAAEAAAGPDRPSATVYNDLPAAATGRAVPFIPGYQIEGELGRGSMGVVYKARQIRLNRSCALKMILAGEHASSEVSDRFLAEAKTVARLRHPNIVAIYNIGDHEGRCYLELEHVDGGSLAQQLDGTPWPPKRAARLVETLAQAIAAAHREGVIHRDLKPGNVLLAGEGTPKITDFGLAKSLGADSSLTRSGAILGSPSYMAPEQAEGNARDVGAEADVYALGAVLYELLTGRPPFRSATVLQTLDLVRSAEPVSPSRLVPGTPRDIETIALKCLRKEPSRRYASAVDLAADLSRFLADQPILARPVGRATRLWLWCRRNPALATALAAVAASLLIGMATTSHYAIQAGRGEREALEAKTLSDRRWYAAEINLAQKEYDQAQIAALLQRLDDLKPHQAGAPDLRGFEWYLLQSLCHLDLRTLHAHSDPVRGIAYSPDGRRLASAAGAYGKPGEVKVWDVATGQELLRLRGHKDLVSCVAFSPDGKRIAAANGGVRTPGEIRIWDAADGRELLCVHAHATPIIDVAFSPDGRRLASASSGVNRQGGLTAGEVKIWDGSTGQELLRIGERDAPASDVDFSPDGRQVALTDGKTLRVCDASTGKELRAAVKHRGEVNSVVFSPDGRLLASGSLAGEVRIFDAATGEETLSLHFEEGISQLAFSPDSQRLAAGGLNRIIKIWNLTTGGEVLALRGHQDAVAGVAFSPDGWRLASCAGDGTVKIWDTVTPAEAVVMRGTFGSVEDLAFHPDSRSLAIAGSDGVVRVRDAFTAMEILALHGHSGSVRCVACSRDGKRLASAGDDRTVRVWDAHDGSEIFCLRGHTATVQAVAFSPDGALLASASGDSSKAGRSLAGAIKLWDLKRGEEACTLTVPTGAENAGLCSSLAFSPDGRWLAAGEGQTVRVWDVPARGQPRTLSSHDGAVTRVAFSPDSRHLASASHDQSIQVWDHETGEVMTLRGHTSAVSGLAYSADGRRLFSTSGGTSRGGKRLLGEVKIWETLTGQEIVTLHGAPVQIPCVAFAPNGQVLAASGDAVVTIWHGSPTQQKLADQRQARSLVKFLCSKSLPRDAITSRLREDATISEGVRQQALALVEPYWKSQLHKQAEELARAIRNEHLLRSEVIAHLRDDRGLSEPLRQEALAVAEHLVESPIQLDRAGLAVARVPGAEPSAYRLALRRAETACRLMPFRASYQLTRALALYRLGKYPEALATLTLADQLNEADHGDLIPTSLALLAMTHFRLGQWNQGEALLDQLRALLQEPVHANDQEAQSLFKEAEALLPGRQ